MRCPRDNALLSRKICERVFGECCDSCGGLFLSGKSVPTFNSNNAIEKNSKTSKRSNDSDNISCPNCDHQMKMRCVDDIEIDICEKCFGVWFDKTEAQAVIEKYGGVDQNTRAVPFPSELVQALAKWFL